jgi:hypothetical protein
MSSLLAERLTYLINFVFIASLVGISHKSSLAAGDKVVIIYLSWVLLVLFFFLLSFLFYRSNVKGMRKANVWFRVVSIFPGIYLIPGMIFHMDGFSKSDYQDYLFVFGGIIWIIINVRNIAIRNTHAMNT